MIPCSDEKTSKMAKKILVAVFVAFVIVAKVHGSCSTCTTKDIDPVCGTDGERYDNPSCLESCGVGVSSISVFEFSIIHNIGLILSI